MASHHIGVKPVVIQRPLQSQVCSEHCRLSVLCLLQFVLCLCLLLFREVGTEDKTRQCFPIQNIDHRLVGLGPHLLNCAVALMQIVSHTNILAALTRVHVCNFGVLVKWSVVCDQDALCLKEAPLFFIVHRFDR